MLSEECACRLRNVQVESEVCILSEKCVGGVISVHVE